MKYCLYLFALLCAINAEETRLLDLEPNDAQQIIEKQDQSLNYAPLIESSVPAIRFLGEEPHNVLEDIYLAKQYHGQDGIGGYLYGYNIPDIAKTEKKKAGGDLRGAYNYIAGNGQEIKVEYWDDGTGFHQVDNVPKILPKQIDDLPAVKAAKEEHLRLWKEQAERNSHPVASPYNSEGKYASGPLSDEGQRQRAQQFAVLEQQQSQFRQPQQYQPQQPQYQPQQPQYQPQQPQYQQPKYQQNQYQQPQFLGSQSQQTNQYHSIPVAVQQGGLVQPVPAVQPNYQASQTQQSTQYHSAPSVQPLEDNNDGSYNPSDDESGKYVPGPEEEPQGPPKGFFYSFDYPVGKIVADQGRALPASAGAHPQAKREDIQQIYSENKDALLKQLQSGSGAAHSYSVA